MPQHRFMSHRKMLLGEDSNALVFLFAVNMLIFILINFIKIVYYLTDAPIEQFQFQIVEWFSMPSTFANLLHKPWTFFFHFFSQYSFWQLVSSMIWLWSFGYILQDLSGNNHVIPIYMYAGMFGALTFLGTALIAANVYQPLLGAGAGVMGIAVATTTLAPKYKLFPLVNGGIPLWILTVVFVLLDFSSASAVTPVLTSHVVSALVGFLYIKQLQRGRNLGDWMIRFYHWGNNLFAPAEFKNSSNTGAKSSSQEEKLNNILDKMNLVGYDNLSAQDKAFLKDASKE
jgi:membrane associated rhomboid family serine protease